MPMIQIEAQLTPGQLLKAVERMPQEDLDRFVEQVVVLRASQRAPRSPGGGFFDVIEVGTPVIIEP